jgi:carbon starvation protein CstA
MVDSHTCQGFNLQPQEIDRLEQESGEKNLRGRTGGAVTLAARHRKDLRRHTGLSGFMKYWYHFAIMFEALFILTTIDTGTRVARFLVGEFGGRFYKKLEEPNWLPGSVVTSALCRRVVGGLSSGQGSISDDLADVWHRQSTAGRCGFVCGDDNRDQLGQSALRVGDDCAALICKYHDARGRF